MYYVYIVVCSDKSLYTGIAIDLVKRVREHNLSSLGAKYTKGRRPVSLVYRRAFSDRSEASKEEARIKKLSKAEKLELIKNKEQ